METISKLWDLDYEVESPKKVRFLYYQDALSYSWRGKGRGKGGVKGERGERKGEDRRKEWENVVGEGEGGRSRRGRYL